MPLQALRTVAKSQQSRNEVHTPASTISPPSNNALSAFLKHQLPAFAAQNPSIEISVSPRPGRHPVIKGQYINGREKAICVRNMEATEVTKKAELLKTASGEKLRRDRKPVKSFNESVRGVWSPFHGRQYKI
ncbi:39S ribosomal protein L51, mitochondrial [Friedmanniomyces endolithicus]|uniref:Large ribosomal subunit protein mL43 n=1 Tax=Rachicladosporium monterosium TaxID=1507873 RepID=A0ABR0LGP4_9PEZI|nr:39S ribosomal protein L51, mitochondrial [Friedmanniomyces endolithicus]KAK0938135.1 39S ribosomal protein L51, mitochondrial [Friedmanniomyces endolithicus]KAK1089666.1 39S ribosomal protein L51, mitochondrial [Friedmanniomyces endolithicus]KAK1813772.1 39S ribosomal protein L51, mitochondrial [Friedmanniomyces endolithicus]KAK5148448.1 39S ribosomal protein L51, mitochondrial [Rachicladosporium monterosium]